eukprot:Amastigsp_a174555_19.p4 type:complete len:114 gc:universal Amastigsp_a174555_19:566-225(-)
MRRHAHGDRRMASGDEIGHSTRLWEQDREWSGPEAIEHSVEVRNRRTCRRVHKLSERAPLCNVDNEWVVARALLGTEDPLTGARVERVRPEPIHSLCGQYNNLALPEKRRGAL